MSRRAEPQGYGDRLTESLADEIERAADLMAWDHGTPTDMAEPSERRKVGLWGRSDPAAPYGDVLTALLTTGVPPEQMAGMALFKIRPELAEVYAAPVEDSGVADRLARLAEHPFRLALFDHLDPKDRVKVAERLDREWQKTRPVAVPEETAPMQPAPPPSMPMPIEGAAPAPMAPPEMMGA